MPRLIVIISPKCIVSMPNLARSGRKIGVRIKVAEMMSINMPIISSNMFTDKRKIHGEAILSTTAEAIFPGICSKVRYSLPLGL